MFRLCIVPASLESFGAIRNKEGKYYARLTEEASSFDEIKKKRRLSTEIVVDEKGNIVKDTSWLWDWEKPVSYASRCIEDKVSIDVSPHILKENDKRFLKDKNGQFKFF